MSRDGRPMTLGDFVGQMSDFFEMKGKNQVKGCGSALAAAVAPPAALATV